jgi:hypothetical protein
VAKLFFCGKQSLGSFIHSRVVKSQPGTFQKITVAKRNTSDLRRALYRIIPLHVLLILCSTHSTILPRSSRASTRQSASTDDIPKKVASRPHFERTILL